MLSYARYCACPVIASTFVIAAVNVVFPWSTCPIVPTLQCGFVLSNFAFAILPPAVLGHQPLFTSYDWPLPISIYIVNYGAHDRNRTGDLILTKDVLCQLSYMGTSAVTRYAL